jgi:predicted DNA-binding protein (MmcQ/YjbR family)
LPESGWVSFPIGEPEDVEKAIALLRRSYDLAVKQRVEASARETR